jgi:phosphopantetheinyl transferase
VTRYLIVRDAYDLAYFTDDELAIANAFKLQKRRDEWLLARYAAKRLALDLGVVANPRDFVVQSGRGWFVSLSHSAPYAAAAIDREPVGIDIQVVRDVAESAAHLFLSDAETAMMRRCTIADRLLHFWCAKEAAWKPRSHEFTTLRQLPMTLREERADGLSFDLAETHRFDDLILAITV